MTPVLNYTNKESYRLVSILSHISKVFERIRCNQFNDFMKDKLSNIPTDFRKGHSAQHSLLIVIEKSKRVLDENMKVGAIVMDISKAFDILNHRLLLAKLKAYGLQSTALKQMENSLTDCFQRTKGSNIFINYLFLYQEETCLSNYADDNTLYSIGNTIERVKKALRNDFRIIENWFHENVMVLNATKYHYKCCGIGIESDDFIFDGIKLPSSCEEKV